MDISSAPTVIDRAQTYNVKRRHAGLVTIVEKEREWRAQPSDYAAWSEPKVGITRWRSLEQRTCEVSAETPSDGHLISIVMRNKNVRLSISGRVVHDGAAIPGMLQITEPTVSARCVFRGPYDVLHLHVPNSLLAEFGRDITGHEPTALRSAAVLTQDPVAERLGRALLAADEIASSFGRIYADCISTAIVTRLLAS